MSNNCNNHKALAFFFGLLAGAVIGGGLGLLLAPAKGEETRKKLKKRGKDIKEKVGEIYEDVREASQPLLEAAEEFEPVIDQVKQVVSEVQPALTDSAKEKISAVSSD